MARSVYENHLARYRHEFDSPDGIVVACPMLAAPELEDSEKAARMKFIIDQWLDYQPMEVLGLLDEDSAWVRLHAIPTNFHESRFRLAR